MLININMEFEKSTVFDLAESVAYSENATVSKMVIQKANREYYPVCF